MEKLFAQAGEMDDSRGRLMVDYSLDDLHTLAFEHRVEVFLKWRQLLQEFAEESHHEFFVLYERWVVGEPLHFSVQRVNGPAHR